MPHLNPAPWLFILVVSWSVFLTVLPAKVVKYMYPHEPGTPAVKEAKPDPWSWPWY